MKMKKLLTLLLAVLLLAGCAGNKPGTFEAGKNTFLLNGKPFVVKAAEVHYPRIPREYWEHRIEMCKALGMNTLCLYVFWNLHEETPGKYDFTGNKDIAAFCKLAQKHGMYVIVRPGPYVCAEWEMGGLPWWLLKNDSVQLRTLDPFYMQHVGAFMHEVGKQLEDLQITRGGNIIMVQVENEYGSYGNDKEYLRYIEKLMLDCGTKVMLFTSDGDDNSMLSGGTLPDVFKTLNFGSRASEIFNAMDRFHENTPKMCTEFWCGWGEEHHTRGSDSVAGEIKDFLDIDASFNFYMFHGGTNFGFTAGANCYEEYQPTVTSYDYCALLTEWGDYAPAYYAVRELLLKAQNLPETELPASPELQTIGKVELDESTSLMSNFDNLGEHHRVPLPESMEYFGQNSGMIYYETKLEQIYDPRAARCECPRHCVCLYRRRAQGDY